MKRSRLYPLAVAVACALLLIGCGASESDPAEPDATPSVPGRDPGPVHVHGLGINPKDRALFIATHTGLFRAAAGEREATRVADRWQDTMGFTIVGPDEFLGSGHPDGREKLPPFLGLIRSVDAGETWRPISRMGKSDFHVLEARGARIYGSGSDFETREPETLVSDDGGRTWREIRPPGALLALAIHPRDPDHVVVATEGGLARSTNAGRSWRPLRAASGLLAWPTATALFLVENSGTLSISRDGGRSWREVGQVGGQPAAFEDSGSELYAALHDGTVKRSADDGATWTVRTAPGS